MDIGEKTEGEVGSREQDLDTDAEAGDCKMAKEMATKEVEEIKEI